MKLNIRREISRSYGDLSNLRPRSPPIQNMPARFHTLHLSPGNYVDDTQNPFSSNFNRQARQALPSDWLTGASCSHPSNTVEGSAPIGQQMYHSLPYGTRVPHHMEAEPAKISIQGLTSGHFQPRDFYIPITRSHPGGENQRREALQVATGRNLTVEHINISTVWKGLSDMDANELFRIHQAFVSTLEKMLANELWQIYQQLQQQDSAGNISPIHTLFSTGIIRGISFCRDQLVSEMVEALYSSKENAAKAQSGFLRLFLVTSDALVQHHEDSSHDTSVTIRMRCDPLSPRPHPVVDAAWVPDVLVFDGLDDSPLEGQYFSIVPKYYSKSAFRPTQFPKNVNYSIESESRNASLSWLVWDDDIAGFKGIVPFYSEVNSYDRSVSNIGRKSRQSVSHSLRILVQAVLIDDNDSSVHYERILRARLTINVAPWYVNSKPPETKERLSVPKAYQDARLASAAQSFALQDPVGGPCPRGQSPSGISQRSQGVHPCLPTKDAATAQMRFRARHSVISPSATGTRIQKTDLRNLARTQAYLVARCARLARELEDIKEQIKIGEHHNITLHVTDPQESIDHTYGASLTHQTGQKHPICQSSVPCISPCAPEDAVTPPSPTLNGGDHTSQLGLIARFPALPPPAIGLRAHPKSDLQIKDRNSVNPTHTGWYLTPAPGTTSQSAAPESSTTQSTHTHQETDYVWRLPDRASIFSNGTSGLSTSPRRIVEDLSKQKTGAHTAEPDRNTLSLSKPDDQGGYIPTQWSSDISDDSFDRLRSLRSSTTLANEEAPCSRASERAASTESSKNTKHGNEGPIFYMDTETTDKDHLVNKAIPANSSFEDGATGLPSISCSSDWNRESRLRQSPSTSFSPRHVCINSTNDSRSTSSDMEIIVEHDPRARGVSRQEQAKAWKMLSRSDENGEDQPGPNQKEVRLSEDEKKAIDEAMQRSLDDLAGGFDDIFLENSSESTLSDGEL